MSERREGVSLAVLAGVVFVSTLAAMTLYNITYNYFFVSEEEETSCLQLPGPAHNAPAPPPLPKPRPG